MYTVQRKKPPVIPSDLSIAAKDHCTQGPGAKRGSQEIGACTPKQPVTFDLVYEIRLMSKHSDSDE